MRVRRSHRWRFLLPVLVLVLAACGTPIGPEQGSTSRPVEGRSAPAPSDPSAFAPGCQPAPLQARAASVLAVGIGEATRADDALPAQVASLGVGGVILLGPNVVDADQVRALTGGLRQRAPRGLVVSVDEEGGRVSRLRPIVGATPSARTLGQRPMTEITSVAAERGTVLRDLGFDLALAPVVDADGGAAGSVIGDRAFAGTADEAGARAGAFVEGLTRSGVASAAKHFPGQGELADSHDGPVVFDAPRDELVAAAAAGFGPVLDAGAAAVMMSHVSYPALGPLPASVEPAAYDLLRSFGFDGVAMTDAMNMSAIAPRWPLPEATVMALVAGADLVLATPGQEAPAMRDAIVTAVGDGRLPEARLDEAVARVLELRGEDPATMVCR